MNNMKAAVKRALVDAILASSRGTADREDPEHPLSGLLDLIVPAVEAYEAVHYPMEPGNTALASSRAAGVIFHIGRT